MIKIFNDNNIKYFIFDHNISPNATMIIESFNRTLRKRLDKYKQNFNTKRYIDVL